jgi:hypothetical protein
VTKVNHFLFVQEDTNMISPFLHITAITNHFGSKPLKLAFDGKKISRGKGKNGRY